MAPVRRRVAVLAGGHTQRPVNPSAAPHGPTWLLLRAAPRGVSIVVRSPALANISFVGDDRVMNSAALDAETFGPEERPTGELIDFLEALRSRGLDVPEAQARLVSKDGTESIPLPDELFRVLKYAAENLAEGRAITMAPVEKQLTTQEAAEFLGMSRPSLIKIVDRGELSCSKVGRHRRLRLGDLLDYQRERAEARRRALDEMVDIALDNQLYEATEGPAEGIR